MTDQQVLIFIHQRLVKVYGENPNVDYMHRFREAIAFSKGTFIPFANDYSQAVLDHINKQEKTYGNTY